MNATGYQKAAARTLIDAPGFAIRADDLRLVWDLLRLAGAVAQAVELAKKGVFHQHGVDPKELDAALRQVLRRADDLLDRMPADEVDKLSASDVMLLWNATGLVGEAGEVAGAVQEAIAKGEQPAIAKELGDTEWYIAALCSKLGLDLGDVMAANIAKLAARYPNGYSAEDSRRRVDTVITP